MGHDNARSRATNSGRLADRYSSPTPVAGGSRTDSRVPSGRAASATPTGGRSSSSRSPTAVGTARADHRYSRPGLRPRGTTATGDITGSNGLIGSNGSVRSPSRSNALRTTRSSARSGVIGVAPSLGRRQSLGATSSYLDSLSHRRNGNRSHSSWSWWSSWGTPCYTSRWGFWTGSYGWCNPHYFWTIYSPFTFNRYTSYFGSYSYNYDYCWWSGRRTYIPTAWYAGYDYGPDIYVNVYADEGAVDDTALASAPIPGAGAPVGAVPAAPASSEGLADRFIELGDFYFKEGRFADAADSYARARTYAPDDATIHFVLADALFATGDYHFAAFLIAEAVRLDPTIVDAIADKRTFYGEPKAFDTQMTTLEGYISDKPYDAAAHFVYGYNLYFSARPADTVSAMERVLAIEPTHTAAQAFLAAAKGRVEAAAKAAEAAKEVPAEIR